MTTAVGTDKPCGECGNDINHLRVDAKFCNAECRKKYHRRKEKINRLKLSALIAINEIERMMTDNELEFVGSRALSDIAKMCNVDTIRNERHKAQELERLNVAAFLESRRQFIANRGNGSEDE